MAQVDEPVLGPEEARTKASDGPRETSLPERIRALVEGELYAVLCTQGQEQAYGSLVAFAFSDDLTAAVFGTPVTTRKYQLLADCDRVSLVVDNRPTSGGDMTRIEAITATGRAVQLERGQEEFDRWARKLLERHDYLEPFVAARSTALFRIDVARFFHVVRFQEVQEWIPTRTG